MLQSTSVFISVSIRITFRKEHKHLCLPSLQVIVDILFTISRDICQEWDVKERGVGQRQDSFEESRHVSVLDRILQAPGMSIEDALGRRQQGFPVSGQVFRMAPGCVQQQKRERPVFIEKAEQSRRRPGNSFFHSAMTAHDVPENDNCFFHVTVKNAQEQLLLGAEVVIDHGMGDAHALCNPGCGRGIKARAVEFFLGCRKYLIFNSHINNLV